MYLWLNRRFTKNALLFLFLLIAMNFSVIVFQNISISYLIAGALIVLSWELFASYKASESTQIQLIQSYLDKKFILSIFSSIHLDKALKVESLSIIADNILDYFSFYSVNIYQMNNEHIKLIYSSGDSYHKEFILVREFWIRLNLRYSFL
jgi:hypothetical protein